MQIPRLQFKILALAPFNGSRSATTPAHVTFPVDRFSLDAVIRQIQCRCFLPLEKSLCPDGGLHLDFNNFKTFHPDGLLQDNSYLRQLYEAAGFIDQSRKQGKPAAAIQKGLQQWPDLPPLTITEPVRSQKTASSDKTLGNLLDMVALPDQSFQKDMNLANPAQAILNRIITQLFGLSEFRVLEAAWRGLRFLLQKGAEDNIGVEIAAVQADTLEEDLNALTPYLIKALPGAILLDLPFDNTPLATAQLAAAARWAADLMVPIIAWASPEFLQMNNWQQLNTLAFIPSHLESPAYAKFRSLKTSEEGKWLCLACNRFLVRYPYGADNPPRRLVLNEPVDPWISPVWAVGTLLAQSVEKTGWPTRFTDPHNFKLEDLALFSPNNGLPLPTETHLNRERLDQLARAGLTPLAAEEGRDIAFTPRAVTIQGGSLAYQLLLSQVTRFILWCKDNLPAETSNIALQTQLKLAFQIFSEQSRPPGFASMDITTHSPDADGRIPVTLSVIPAAAILPSREPIELNLAW